MLESGRWQWRQKGKKDFSVAVAGDVCSSFCGGDEIISGHSKDILREIQPALDQADLRLVQWEMVISDHSAPILKCGPNLLAPPETVDFLTAGNFEVALLANNHTGDHSPAGIMDTIRFLEKKQIKTVGAGANQQAASQPLKLEKNGFKITIFNFCEMEFGTSWGNVPGSNAMDEFVNLQQIADAKAQADIVLVVIHGGNEYNPIPTPRMRKLYQAFARFGASAVVNIHTHCPQGIEVVDNVPIIYAPGNFYFPDVEEYDLHSFWWSGYLPRIAFDENGAYAVEVTPYYLQPEPWKIKVLQGNQRQWFLDYLDRISQLLVTEGEFWYDVWCAYKYSMMFYWIDAAPAKALIEDCADPEALKKLPAIRHMLTCQSHCDVARRAMLLLERGLMAEAAQAIPRLNELRVAHFCDQKI